MGTFSKRHLYQEKKTMFCALLPKVQKLITRLPPLVGRDNRNNRTMGQYYRIIILADNTAARSKEVIRAWTDPHDYGDGSKLMEHSYLFNEMLQDIETMLSPNGAFHCSRLVWAGDYAENDTGEEENLYRRCEKEARHLIPRQFYRSNCSYIVNHTKKEYIDKGAIKGIIHPLPLLTSEGNGAGGGDYRGDNEYLCGSWARDMISMEYEKPEGYTERVYDFAE